MDLNKEIAELKKDFDDCDFENSDIKRLFEIIGLLDKEKIIVQLQNEIISVKSMIVELTEENRNIDVIFYKGKLQAYESVQNWFFNA